MPPPRGVFLEHLASASGVEDMKMIKNVNFPQGFAQAILVVALAMMPVAALGFLATAS